MKYEIVGEVLLKPIRDGWFELAEDVLIIKHDKYGSQRFDISKGFVTDMGSIPRIFRRWFPYIGNQYLSASYLLHDVLFATQSHCHDLTKKTVDNILWEMITTLPTGVAEWKVNCIWKAVDWFGWGPWEDFDHYDQIAIAEKQLTHTWTDK